MEEVAQIVKKLEKECGGALSFVDILFNHVSPDSELLLKCPEALYNEKTAPHLTVAIELDKALTKFSDDFANKKFLKEYEKGNRVESEEDLNKVMDLVKQEVFEKHKFTEYFLLDMDKMHKLFQEELAKQKIELEELEQDIGESDNFLRSSKKEGGHEVLYKFMKNLAYN